ncbi:Fe-S cluster assembly sulfur transfer protein SufU [Candidatus Neomarinimicrobiota bacterium]
MSNLNELYQEVILDHNQNPRNFKKLEVCSHAADGHNPLCGDQLTLYLNIADDKIEDVSFTGSGCAISTASASIMTTVLKGQTIKSAIELFDRVHELITTGQSDKEIPTKLMVLSGVHKYPVRVKCASLSWHTMKNVLEENTKVTKTE